MISFLEVVVMVSQPGSISRTEAQSFATAMAGLAAEKGTEKGYIREAVTANGRTFTYIPPGSSESPSGKMSAKDIVSISNKVSQFAKENIGDFSGKELKNIELGVGRLQNRIKAHGDRLGGFQKAILSIFSGINFDNFSASIESINFRGQLQDLLKNAESPKLLQKDQQSIAENYLEDKTGRSLEECKNDKLITKFKQQESVLVHKLKDYGVSDSEINHTIQESRGIKDSALNPTLLQEVKGKIGSELTNICSNNRYLPELEQNQDFKKYIQKYQQTFPSTPVRSSTEIVKELTKIDLMDKPINRFRSLVVPQQGATSTHTALLHQAMRKIDISQGNPEDFAQYTETAADGYFLAQQKNLRSSGEDKIIEGEITLTHMFSLCDHLDMNPSTDPNISKLHEDLKRSLPLAFESGVIGADEVQGKKLEAEADKLSGKIYEALAKMAPGERLFLPMGCDEHATLLMMTKKDNGEVEVQHYNTGYGVDEHNDLIGFGQNVKAAGRTVMKDAFPIGVKANIRLDERKGDITSAISGLIRVSHGKGTTMKDATSHFRKLVGKERGFTVSASRKEQQAQNCSFRCLLEGVRASFIRDALNAGQTKDDGVKSYRDFKIGLIDRLEQNYEKVPPNRQRGELIPKLQVVRNDVEKKVPGKKERGREKVEVKENIPPNQTANAGEASKVKKSKSKSPLRSVGNLLRGGRKSTSKSKPEKA